MVELIAGIMALRSGQLFATKNYRTPDPACPVDVVREPRDAGGSFLKLSVTPQGQAACLLVKRFAE
jgi:3-oxoacyl-[acyl-carrier-protein] synthase II